MKKIIYINTLIVGLAANALHGAVIYGNDSFEGESTGTCSTTANTTNYINDADNAANVEISGNVSSVGSTAADPTGQHIFARGNLNKRFTQANAMTLASDSIVYLSVTFKTLFNNTASTNDGRVLYSAAGDFSD